MQTVRVSNWNELNDQVFRDSWKPDLNRFRSDFAFRGIPDARFDLATSLARLGGNYADLESHMLRNFRKYAISETHVGDSVWNWISLAQHHGLPTRVLDWSYSPFVAMHFVTAASETVDHDGVIWCVDYVKAHRLLPERLRDLLQEEGSNVFTVDLLDRAAEDLSAFDALSEEPFVVFYEPPSIDQRLINQYALFSLMSNPSAGLDEWIAQHPDLCRRIIIPAGFKWEIRDKLDQANITERVLFPGLDGLSKWLRRHYQPRVQGESRPEYLPPTPPPRA